MPQLLVKTTAIKYTMSPYEYDSEFLKSVGQRYTNHQNAIAGVVMTNKYRHPPIRIVKQDGKKVWRAEPVQDDTFMTILNSTGRTGNWVVTYGNPTASIPHMKEISSEEVWNIQEFDIYNSPLGPVALVTQVNME